MATDIGLQGTILMGILGLVTGVTEVTAVMVVTAAMAVMVDIPGMVDTADTVDRDMAATGAVTVDTEVTEVTEDIRAADTAATVDLDMAATVDTEDTATTTLKLDMESLVITVYALLQTTMTSAGRQVIQRWKKLNHENYLLLHAFKKPYRLQYDR